MSLAPSLRAHLYVPGDQPQMIAKADTRGADAIIFDLEDSVGEASKDRARDLVGEALRGPSWSVPRWVRINGFAGRQDDRLRGDIDAIVSASLSGVIVPKIESPDELLAVDSLLNDLEARRGLAEGSTAVVPLIESARALEEMRRLAGVPRVARLQLGERDLAADLGIEVGPEEYELLVWRSQLVATSRAAGLSAPVASAEPAIADLVGLAVTSQRLRRLGFGGRTAVHPSQVAVIQRAFAPDPGDVAHARMLLASYEVAVAEGRAVAEGPDGEMVDEAVARSARHLLAQAGE